MKKPKHVDKRAENLGPTPETARKLRVDPLLALYHAGTITGTHLRCAEEISTAFSLLTLPVSMRCSNYEREGRSDPVGRLGLWAELIERRGRLICRYRDWRSAIRKRRLSFRVIEAVVVDRQSCTAVTKRFRARNGTVGEVVRSALDLYAIVAGYAQKPA